MTGKFKKVFLGNGTQNEINFRIVILVIVINMGFALKNASWGTSKDIIDSLIEGAIASLKSGYYWFFVGIQTVGLYFIFLPLNNYNKKKAIYLSLPIFGFFYSIYLKQKNKKTLIK